MSRDTASWIDATGDVVAGDTIKFTEGVFGGSRSRPKYLGEREVTAVVERESYGAEKQQHTFSIKVIDSSGYDALDAGLVTRRKGRNIYRNGTKRLIWDDEAARRDALAEKHARGGAARQERDARRFCS